MSLGWGTNHSGLPRTEGILGQETVFHNGHVRVGRSLLWRIAPPHSPSVLAMPVFTLSVQMWLIRFSCSGLASTTIRMFQRVWIAIW